MDNRVERPAIFGKKNHNEPRAEDTSDSKIEETVTLAWAAVLARKGKLKQAEALLHPLANKPQAIVAILDLLAKVYAQQRKIVEARSLWLRAVQLNPDNTHFYRALIRCADLLKHM